MAIWISRDVLEGAYFSEENTTIEIGIVDLQRLVTMVAVRDKSIDYSPLYLGEALQFELTLAITLLKRTVSGMEKKEAACRWSPLQGLRSW